MWCKTRTADGKTKSMPVDVTPARNGNCWFEDGVLVFASKDRPKPEGVRLFRSHFVDCPGYKAKKDLERRLKGTPACSCQVEACDPEACAHCGELSFGAACPATGVPR